MRGYTFTMKATVSVDIGAEVSMSIAGDVARAMLSRYSHVWMEACDAPSTRSPPARARPTQCWDAIMQRLRRRIHWRKLKSVMARKADDELDPKRGSALEHELPVARTWPGPSSHNPTVSGWITLARSMPTCRSVHFGSISRVR